MNKIIIILVLLSLAGCTIVGSQLGAVIDKKTGKDKY